MSRVRALATSAAVVAAVLSTAPSAHADSSFRTVTYHGTQLEVPSSWPVVDLSTAPSGCVRLDRSAVYLGTPAVDDCPAHLLGGSEVIQVGGGWEPTGGSSQNAHQRTYSRSASAWHIDGSSRHAEVAILNSVDDAATRTVLGSVRSVAGYSAPRQQLRQAPAAASAKRTGLGFDACTAPSVGAMQAWLGSPYRSVNIYMGGADRGCSQANLNAGWVSTVTKMGWSLIPTYVGLQAPCWSVNAPKIDPANAWTQGVQSADDAANGMAALGLGPSNPVYFDMEAYNTGDSSCVAAVETFLDAWTAQLHAHGYQSGVYSSAASGITNMVQETNNSSYHLPDDIWFAHWNGNSSVYGDAYVPDGLWNVHQRIHQYQGGHNETYNGVTINIDSNGVDADTSINGDPVGWFDDASSPAAGSVHVRGWAYDPNAPTTPIHVHVYVGGPAGSGAPGYDLGPTNDPRPDVQNAYPEAGPTTGFDATVPGPAGTYDVYTYSINVGDGSNQLLGSKTLTVAADTAPPSVGVATDAVSLGSTAGVRFAGSDPSGISSFDIRYRRAAWNGAFGGYGYPSSWQGTTARAVSLAVVRGSTYCFSVRGRDGVGNVSAWSADHCTAAPLDERSFTASSGWTRASATAYYAATISKATATGRTLTRTGVRARTLSLVATTCSGCGSVGVYWNGHLLRSISLSASATHYRQVIRVGAVSGTGAVVVKSLSSARVYVDGLAISAL